MASSLDHWRGFFRVAGDSDIFDVIRQAIRVAASDHPDEFKSRRDEIAQMLFAAPHRVEKADEGRGNSIKPIDVKAIEEDDGRGNAVKAIEDKKDDGRGNAIKAIEDKKDDGRGNAVKVIEERQDYDRGNAVKTVGTLLPSLPPSPSEEQKPADVGVDQEKADTMSRETWKVSVSENGKILLRRRLCDPTNPSEPRRTSNPLVPSNQEFLPAFTEPPLIAPSTGHPQGRLQRTSSTEHRPEIAVAQPEPPRLLPNMPPDDALLRSKLEMSKRKLREGYQQTENAKRQRRIQVIQPRAAIPKDCNKKPCQFKTLGTWLR
ncbi:probable mediator of RNA polymerase II transcription subunit 26c [Zingiber officinale]|uniref:probable mediator of RNA polymerase II transcription subunit 26c n=1 Tax=Zingiber officinale TaxID=94328 RepID=UPI001C4B8220|nr:probable mediator of RNA polymerase II transcription subunit 26c [Zingiber officinale]